MQLGAFSVSLNISDIHASKDFYEKLGFETSGGDIDQKWLIMKNGGIKFLSEANETGEGPASCIIKDPNGNPVLFDQHRREVLPIAERTVRALPMQDANCPFFHAKQWMITLHKETSPLPSLNCTG